MFKNCDRIFKSSKSILKLNAANGCKRFTSDNKRVVILGIETSCDDTGVAVVDNKGNILGEALHSQIATHVKNGGIIPPVAQSLHEHYIQGVYEEALKSANLELKDIDAIATTVKPGLALPLIVGKNFGKNLSNLGNKPFIPIHHMQAHALTVRMVEKVDYPYLVLLISGGHCLLAIVQSVDKFYVLGTTLDDSPGDTFDKIARSLRLNTIPEFENIHPGKAIELLAKKAENPDEFPFTLPMSHYRDCNFSFSGIKTAAKRHIQKQLEFHNLSEDSVIPNANNLCAALSLGITRHLCSKTQRAMEYINRQDLIPSEKKVLVVSGGVASNDFIAKALDQLCKEMDFKLVRTPKKLCTDNGVMIAWNGVERYLQNSGVLTDRSEISKVDITDKEPIGEDWRSLVAKESIKLHRIKYKFDELIRE